MVWLNCEDVIQDTDDDHSNNRPLVTSVHPRILSLWTGRRPWSLLVLGGCHATVEAMSLL